MKWPFRRRRPQLDDPQAEGRLQSWLQLPSAATDQPIASTRWVVVDTETSGLDIDTCRLLSIGAVAIRDDRLCLGDSFETVLQQPVSSSVDNILIHGISGNQQRAGQPMVPGLLDFLEFVGSSPLLAFHARFDATVLDRALQQTLGITLQRPWLDLAWLAPALWPEQAAQRHSLDDWAAAADLVAYARHSALADAAMTAELWLALRPRMTVTRSRDLHTLEATQREAARLRGS